MRLPVPSFAVPALVAILTAGVVQAAPELDLLGDDVRAQIAERCLPLQFLSGREAYRNCVLREAEANAAAADPLAALEFDERVVVSRSCELARNDGDEAFAGCVVDALAGVEPARPARGALAEEVRRVRAGCLAEGPEDLAAHRACLRDGFAQLGALPRPALADSGAREQQTILTDCGQDTESAFDFRRCVNAATGAVADSGATDDTRDVLAAAPDSPSTADNAGERVGDTSGTREAPAEPSSTDAIDATEPLDEPDASGSGDDEAAGAANGNDLTSDFANVVGTVLSTAGEQFRMLLDATDRVVADVSRSTGFPAVAVYASAGLFIAILVMMLALVRRHRRRRQRFAPAHDFDLERDDDALYDAIDELDLAQRDTLDERSRTRYGDEQDSEPLATETDDEFRRVPVDEHAVTRLAPGPWLGDDDAGERDVDLFEPDDAAAGFEPVRTTTTVDRGSEFARWLDDEHEDARFAHAMEFVIYWIAYGDGRYPDSLRERLFAANELTPRDRIKRWVLQEDVEAFADAVNWLQAHTSALQRAQLLDLLMALLVREHGITPVQTTVLRLLADRFDIGAAGIEAAFEEAFGEALPPLPRPDRTDWWETQGSETIASWAPTYAAQQDELGRARSLLGLASDHREVEVIRAYRRAVKRCHPDRFSTLGPRARALAIRQFDRFEEARDRLLGIAV